MLEITALGEIVSVLPVTDPTGLVIDHPAGAGTVIRVSAICRVPSDDLPLYVHVTIWAEFTCAETDEGLHTSSKSAAVGTET